MLASQRKGIVQSVGKNDLVEPWVPIAKIDDASIEKHPPHADERRIEHGLDFFSLCLETLAPLLNSFCIVQAKVFDVGRNESGVAHGANGFPGRGDVCRGAIIS